MELSIRETEIIMQISLGFSDKEISDNLNISTRTIQTYVIRICLKLDARNRAHAVTKYILRKLNLVTSPINRNEGAKKF